MSTSNTTTSATTTTTTLLLIDVQKDFHPGGSLAIPSADDDAARIAALIRAHPPDRIVATLDSHQALHIAHPSFWWSGSCSTEEQQHEQHPAPFTIINAEDIRNGVWKPRDDLVLPEHSLDRDIFPVSHVWNDDGNLNLTKYCIEYAEALEKAGRFQICIWPEHCLIGSAGHGLVEVVREAVMEWSKATGRSVEWVFKGQNHLTEMYSALAAEVPITKDTSYNHSLLESLGRSDRLFVCGQALSHCVNYTVRDIVKQWPRERLGDITVLTDCASAVPGFDAAAEVFRHDMEASGVRLKASTDPHLY